MNQVVIHYSYSTQKPNLQINGETISPYSELATVLNRPFLDACPLIIRGLDREVFDEYEIDFYATVFQYEMMLAMKDSSDFCKEIRFHEMESLYPKNVLMERLSFISSQHGITIDPPKKIIVFCQKNILIPSELIYERVESPNADIGIIETIEQRLSNIKIPILLCNSFESQQSAGRTIYGIPKSALGKFWEYYEFEFVILPIIGEYLTALRYTNLTSIQKKEVEAIKNNQADYFIGDLALSMDQGDSQEIVFASFPADAYSVVSENEDVLSCTENRLHAKVPGTTNLIIQNKIGKTVASTCITVIGHQYAEEIRLIPRFEYLKRSERSRIDVVVLPANAEDANQLVWNLSDPNILQIDENGSVIALEAGVAQVTVSGHNVTTSIAIQVKPALQELRFSQQSIRLKNGETVVLDCNTIPPDAPTDKFTWELDNKTIASINPSKDGRRCQVIASNGYEGKGNVRCYDTESKMGAICNIEVISKIKYGLAGKLALICLLLGIIMPFLLPVSALASLYGIFCDEEQDHRMRYSICAIGSIGILIMWLLSAMN